MVRIRHARTVAPALGPVSAFDETACGARPAPLRCIVECHDSRLVRPPASAADLEFQPGLVYSFGWWQHFFDLSTYKVHAGPFVADMVPFMSAQPIQMFIK